MLSDGAAATPTQLPDQAVDLTKLRNSDEGRKLVVWVRSEHQKASQGRTQKVLQWRQNLLYFYGNQWIEKARADIQGLRDLYVQQRKPYYRDQRIINKTRSFVRAEHSKFLSSTPQAVAVPATAEDSDVRGAYAAEQAWQSISERRKLRQHFGKAAWWTILTGNGFIKTWWDQSIVADRDTGEMGDITFGSITPFNLFVPDLREQDIEDQPYVLTAYQRPVSWVKYHYGQQLQGVNLSPSQSSNPTIIEDSVLNLADNASRPDSVVIYEMWAKPGAHEMLPDGGIVIIVDEALVGFYDQGLPYNHGQYPFTKFEHIPTSTFYADSPLVDTNPLQKEYNEWRSRLGDYVRRASAPQIMAPKGSIVPQKVTNEPGLIIEYMPGMQPPQPMQLSQIPQYVMDQQAVIQSDWEDITGQHDASRGQAPAGVSAGTAINYLQEKDDQFLTPQYRGIEFGYEKIAGQALSLFNQYVDMPRKIKTIGADGAFDTMELSGADIGAGLDIRIQIGSAVGESQAAKEAKVMDMFSAGLIPQDIALKLLEVGGPQKVLDVMNVAERKAQRENMKMKSLTPMDIEDYQIQYQMGMLDTPEAPGMGEDPMGAPQPPVDPQASAPDGALMGPPGQTPPPAGPPPIVMVDDFDVHQVHIDAHNKFRMGQEYELLPQPVKDQFEQHVKMHETMMKQDIFKQMLQQLGPNDFPGGDASQSDSGPVDGPSQQGGPTMSGNGAVPSPDLSTGSQG